MPPIDSSDDDVFSGSSSKMLHAKTLSPRRSPSRQSILPRRSTTSLRGPSSLAQAMDEDAANGSGRHSLAHELAVALMPEPSAGSKLLAEEFGIEYDEGAEGIDEQPEEEASAVDNGSTLADQIGRQPVDVQEEHVPLTLSVDIPSEIDPSFGSPVATRQRRPKPEQDAMDILAQDLEKTEKFLSHLRHIDVDATSASHAQPPLEKIASDMIRRINETARDREEQVRELLEYERQFRKIAGEVNGNDILGQLDELEDLEGDLLDPPSSMEAPKPAEKTLGTVVEESQSYNNDWETDPDRNHLGDEDDEDDDPDILAIKDTFPQPPPIVGPPTPGKTIPQLTHLRTFTASLVTSLTAISEHAQVNGAATADAGRKIRALKNKLGDWRTEWDSAEQSRIKIERWEAGIQDADDNSVPGTPTTATRSPGARRRLDGRKVVQEYLHGFEQVLLEASQKTQAIMAAS
ncbi:hypothetical protein NEOLEDRAFT_1134065 [Neolentinus lepideus HHB14362 ss-1]|uniref:Uncharacterized protein n=1 Tax=Neolentinus lepideus HHB14362 ss-1 TaxID=1314782 RepID=A0A165SJE5_9AGAM|nr:hypothetical protein NEOLEDRAFT_1134065 [Neolentinus lepideus HHB14362 ss-1]